MTPSAHGDDRFAVILAGGGSGGHISPGLAIAERLLELNPDAQPLFVCSNRAIDATMLRDAGVEYFPVDATPPARSPIAAVRFLHKFHNSQRAVMKLIRERRVKRVVTLGGFVAAPAVRAARACGVPVLLVNLDTPPGKANRWMAKRSDEVISAIELPDFPGFATKIVGMPIRRCTIAPTSQADCRKQLDLHPDRHTLLVTGASQGSTSINSFVLAFIQAHPKQLEGWQILHLAGHGADAEIGAAYETAGQAAKVLPFLNNMGLAWGSADVAISRAGASSVAEVAHNAVPTLFLPYPYHQDMHQKHNSQPLVDLGAAVMEIDAVDTDTNLQKLGPILSNLMQRKDLRQSMRNKLKSHQFPDAARTIAQMLLVDRSFTVT